MSRTRLSNLFFELATTRLKVVCSTRLSYRPKAIVIDAIDMTVVQLASYWILNFQRASLVDEDTFDICEPNFGVGYPVCKLLTVYCSV